MKYFIKLTPIFLSIIFLSACSTSVKFTKTVKSWEGHEISRLVTSWGSPSDVNIMENGDRVCTWLMVNDTLVTTQYNYYLDLIKVDQVQNWCKTTYTVNKSNLIINWGWNGNACKGH